MDTSVHISISYTVHPAHFPIIIFIVFEYVLCLKLMFILFFTFSAAVSRIVKYLRNDGTPLVTVGGYVHDFVENKMSCDNEYHMLVRVSLLSFKTIAEFMVNIMNVYVNICHF